ncbi:MAG: RusA family crossover junction endodeoxyribonuclease [Thermodesulfovibrionaceae bacterium]
MMLEILDLELPIEPVAQSRPRFSRRGIVYECERVKKFKEAIKWYAKSAFRSRPIEDTPIGIDLTFFIKSANGRGVVKKPDLDNLIKSILDALEGVIYANDFQVVKITAAKLPCLGQEKIKIRAYFIEGDLAYLPQQTKERRLNYAKVF